MPGLVRLRSSEGRGVLLVAVLGSGMAFLDGTVVHIALPAIGRDLDASFGALGWIVNGYLVTLSALMLVGGAVGDRIGRRRTYLIGAAGFAATSLGCALAPSVASLVGARAAQGVAGAFLVPGSLALIQASFHPDDRAAAIGAWSGLAGVTTAVGPLLGGWLVDVASWRWVFLLNLPIAALVLAVGAARLPESRDPAATGGPDLVGGLTGASGLALVTYGLVEAELVVGLLGLGALVSFLVVEATVAAPMLPLGLFRSPAFAGANVVTFAVYSSLGAVLFLLSLVLQQASGYSPSAAGAATVPLTLLMLALSARSGELAQRIGPRVPLTLGPLTVGVGMLLMRRIDAGSSYLGSVLPAVVVFALGLVVTVAPLTATVLAAVEDRRAGVASGVNNAISRVAGLVAVAVLPLIAGLDPGGTVVAPALVEGLHRAVLVGAVVVAGGAGVAWVTVPRALVTEAPAPRRVPEPCVHCGTASPPPPAVAPSRGGPDDRGGLFD